MATIRQKKLASVIVENAALDAPLNAGEIVEKSRYSKSMVIKPGQVLNSEGVREELNNLGFNVEGAKNVVSEIMYNPKVDPNARLRATDQVFKVHGEYSDEKGGDRTLN